MKILKGLSFFVLLNALLGACFDQPEYSVVPEIEFRDIVFIDSPDPIDFDTVTISLDFKDGDGDLGLGPDTLRRPFHPSNYFLQNGSLSDLQEIPVEEKYSDTPPVAYLAGESGKLITLETRKKAGFESLPPYDECYYEATQLAISEPYQYVIENINSIKDTLHSSKDLPDLYIVEDTFYYKKNPYHINIEVAWLVKNESTGNYTEFDWTTLTCVSPFEARFPVLSDKKRPTEGTLTYHMQSTGFLPVFSNKVLKLRIFIRDRALHESNVVESKDFILNNIKR